MKFKFSYRLGLPRTEIEIDKDSNITDLNKYMKRVVPDREKMLSLWRGVPKYFTLFFNTEDFSDIDRCFPPLLSFGRNINGDDRGFKFSLEASTDLILEELYKTKEVYKNIVKKIDSRSLKARHIGRISRFKYEEIEDSEKKRFIIKSNGKYKGTHVSTFLLLSFLAINNISISSEEEWVDAIYEVLETDFKYKHEYAYFMDIILKGEARVLVRSYFNSNTKYAGLFNCILNNISQITPEELEKFKEEYEISDYKFTTTVDRSIIE